MDRLVAVCQSKADQQRWVDNLSHHSDIRNGTRASGGGIAVPPPALPTKAAGSGSTKNLTASSSKANSGPPTAVKGQPPLPPHKQQQQAPPPSLLLPPTPKGVGEVTVSAPATSHVSGCLSACAWDLYDGCYSDTYDGLYLCGPPPEGGSVSLDWYRCCDQGAVQSGGESGEKRLRLAAEKSEFAFMVSNEVDCRGNNSRFSTVDEPNNFLSLFDSVPETPVNTPYASSNPFDLLEDEHFEANKPHFVEICIDCDLPICGQNLKSDAVSDTPSDVNKCNAPYCACLNSSGAFFRFIPDPSYFTRDEHHSQSGSRCKPPYPYSYDKRKEPYVVLTRYFRKLYRKKVITRAMLRALSGDLYDISSAAGVALRRKGRWQDASDELTEEDEICLVFAGDDISVKALYDENELIEKVEDMKGEWEDLGNAENWTKQCKREPSEALMSPIPVRKVYNDAKDARLPNSHFKSNLHKWKYSPYSEREFSIRMSNPLVYSSPTSNSTNPYELTNFFSADDSDVSVSRCDKRHTYTKASATTCSDFLNIPTTVKQASLDSPNHASVSRRPIIVPKKLIGNVSSDASSSTYQPMYKTYVPIILKMPHDKLVCGRYNFYEFPIASNPIDGLKLNNTIDKCSGEERVCADPPSENIYDFVTNSSSGGNICNKTIYERGSSSEEACCPSRKLGKTREYKSLLFCKKKSSQNFYFSSCSAEDTEEDQSDFYASCREFYSSFTHSLSRSEPNIYYNNAAGKPEKQYASHYVQLVCHVGATSPDLKCRCETFSHRSSDSGMVDVHFGRHVDDCPFKIDGAIDRNITLKNMEYSRFGDRSTPTVVSESGTLPHSCSGAQNLPCTMLMSNYEEDTSAASNIITNPNFPACRSSIFVSPPHIIPLDTVSVPSEDTVTEGHGLLTEEQAEVPTYKSGLYAHWWMKATISPEDIRSGAQSKHIAEIAMTSNNAYLKSKSSKASFHAFIPEKQTLHESRYGRGQHVASQEVANESLLGRFVLEPTSSDKCSECETITPEPAKSLHRKPGYESYSSQITIRCNASGSGRCTATANASMASTRQSSVPCHTFAPKLFSDCYSSDPSAANTTLNWQSVTSCQVATSINKPNLVGCPDTAASSKLVEVDSLVTTPIIRPSFVGSPDHTATSKPVNFDSALTTPTSQPVLDVCPVRSMNSIQAVGSSHAVDSWCKLGCYKKSCVVSAENEFHGKTKMPASSKSLLLRQEISFCSARPEGLVSKTDECNNLTNSIAWCGPHIDSAGGWGADGAEGESAGTGNGSSGATAVADNRAERLNNPNKTEKVESQSSPYVGCEHLCGRGDLCSYTIHVEGEMFV